ncbi:MAG: response regulator, partial [Asticcacaulis sp.]|nr:response regulator [Asticcacaulis sp.]
KIILEAIPFDLTEVVARVVEIAGVGVDKTAVELSVTSSVGGVRYVGDPQRIHQVLLNLVSNAVKFTAQGQVHVDVSEQARADGISHLLITVADTGIGMADDAAARIFEKFVQADSSTTRRFGGSGLGLSIARSLAELMGGQLSVTSAVGKGSLFTFALPLAQAEADVAHETRAAAHVAMAKTDVRVLVVDDNDANLLVATALLDDLGYIVHVAMSGAQALDVLKDEPVDIVLMDVQMEGMDGFETTQLIRQWEARGGQPSRPIIAMTALGGEGDRARCLTAGMTDYLSKPIDPHVFDAVLQRHCR